MLTFPPDFSFVIQIISFFVLWFGLKRLLFDPVLRVLEERESRTSGARREAAQIAAAAETSEAEYERRMHEVRLALASEAEATRNAIQVEQRRVLSEAREQANSQLAQLRERLAAQAQNARPAIASEARDLAARIFAGVVGRNLV
jgi:F-type H+-transporting ATPase subunit b